MLYQFTLCHSREDWDFGNVIICKCKRKLWCPILKKGASKVPPGRLTHVTSATGS